MKVRAIWEFDVDDTEMDEEYVDVNELCIDLTKRELDYALNNKQLDTSDFTYEIHPELPSDFSNKENVYEREYE